MGANASCADLRKFVAGLAKDDVPLDDAAAWAPLFTLPVNMVDLAQGLEPDDIRRIRAFQPQNLTGLLFHCIQKLDVLSAPRVGATPMLTLTDSAALTTSSASFSESPGTPRGSVDGAASSDAAPDLKTSRIWSTANNRAALNALFVLTRVIPFALEPWTDADDDRWATAPTATAKDEKKKNGGKSPAAATGGGAPDSDNETLGLPSGRNVVSPYAKEFSQLFFQQNRLLRRDNFDADVVVVSGPVGTMGAALVNVLVRSAFIRDFTLEKAQKITGEGPTNFPSVDAALLWLPGVANMRLAKYSNAEWTITNRRAVVNALLATFSGALYEADPSFSDPLFRGVFVDPRACPLAPTLCCSLLNVLTHYTTFGSLPYTSHVVGQEEYFIYACARVLNVALDTAILWRQQQPREENSGSTRGQSPQLLAARAIEERDGRQQQQGNAAPSPPLSRAQAEELLRTQHTAWPIFLSANTSELLHILDGLHRFIWNRSYARTTRLHGTQRLLRSHGEFFLLFWKLIDRSAAAFDLLVTEPVNALGFVIPLLDYALEARKDASLVGQTQLVMYVLLRLAGSRDFATLLNEPIPDGNTISFELRRDYKGSYADLLILSLLSVIETRHQLRAVDDLNVINDKQLVKAATARVKARAHARQTVRGKMRLAAGAFEADDDSWYLTMDEYERRALPTAIMQLHETCAIVLCNISPYITSLSKDSERRLSEFFLLKCTRPEWLVAHAAYPNILMYIVEVFANLIQYQYTAAVNILAEFCRQRCAVHRVYHEITRRVAATASASAVAQSHHQQQHRHSIGGREPSAATPEESGEIRIVTPGSPIRQAPPNAITAVTADASSSSHATAPTNHHLPTAGGDGDGAEEDDRDVLTLAHRLVIPDGVRERIKIGTLRCAVEAAEGIVARSLALARPTADGYNRNGQAVVERRPTGSAATMPAEILRRATLVGLLPAPHHIIVRRFDPNPATDAWVQRFLWMIVFAFNDGLADWQKVQLLQFSGENTDA